jgi:hypothetical protein
MVKPARKPAKPDEGTEHERELLDKLKDVGARIGIEVREEKLIREVGYTVRGGRCRLEGRDMILLDRNATVSERIEVLADSLARFDLADVYIEPELRRLIGVETAQGDDDESAESAERVSGV